MPSLLGIILSCVATISLITYIRSIYRLRHFKGPLLAITSKAWMLKCCYHKNTHWELKKLCDQYGELLCDSNEETSTVIVLLVRPKFLLTRLQAPLPESARILL